MYLQIHALSQKQLSKETHFVMQRPGLIKLLTAAAEHVCLKVICNTSFTDCTVRGYRAHCPVPVANNKL